MEESTSHNRRTFIGLLYSFVSQFGVQVLRIGLIVILARFFLTPEDFGVYNLAMVVIGFSQIISNFGFGKALIQIDEPTQVDYSTSFWVNIGLGVVLTMSVILAAPYLSSYYQMKDLELVLKVLSISFLLNSATVIQKMMLQKSLDFRHLAYNDLLSYVLACTVALIMAFKGMGLWALVGFNLTLAVVSNIWLWLYLRHWRPSLSFSLASIKKIWSLSFYLFANDGLAYVSKNIDKSLIGRAYGEYLLGLYSQAYALVMVPVTNVSNVVNRVMFPSLSLLQGDTVKIGGIFAKMSRMILLINGFVFGFVFVLASELIGFFLGTQWLPMLPILQSFCILGLLISLRSIQSSVYLSINKNKTLFTVNLVIRLMTIAVLIWASTLSFDAVIVAVVACMAVSYLVTTLVALNLIKMRVGDFVMGHLGPVFKIISAVAITYVLKDYEVISNSLVLGMVYLFTFAVAMFVVRDGTLEESLSILQKLRK